MKEVEHSEMSRRSYYSMRAGKNPSVVIDLPMLRKLFRNTYLALDKDCYFQEAFGYNCVGAGEVAGKLGTDIEAEMLHRLRKTDLWPIPENCLGYSEDDLFDVMEFLHDWVSKPVDGRYHSWGNCGWHYETFDSEAGRLEYRTRINELLSDYEHRYELSPDGEILTLPEDGLVDLINEPLPPCDPDNVEARIAAAVRKFRHHGSSEDEKRDAIRDLADTLEFLRPEIKQVLTRKDESDLFNIANSFGIRHHNPEQKTEYDKPIWYDWMFYYYLATIHAVLRLLENTGQKLS